jgi:hypothetical protein
VRLLAALQEVEVQAAAADASTTSLASVGLLVGPRMVAPPVTAKDAERERARAKRQPSVPEASEPKRPRGLSASQRMGVPSAVVPPFVASNNKRRPNASSSASAAAAQSEP